MGSLDRSKKRLQLWKKAVFHFLLCFVMGFFIGFAPNNATSVFTRHVAFNQSVEVPEYSPEPTEMLDQEINFVNTSNRSLMGEAPAAVPTTSSSDSNEMEAVEIDEAEVIIPRKQLIVITPATSLKNPLQAAFLRRLAYTLSLIPPPLAWIVVESYSDSSELSDILRKTGVMYRHLVYKENFTDTEAEMEHQKNVALNHIEHHRLNGIVHFADIFNTYDLDFFHELREIEVFGTWPMAMVSTNRKRVVVEGPVCASSQVIGWHLIRNLFETPIDIGSSLHSSSFAFNSSILWDPERWGRASSVQDTSQNSFKIVQEVVVEDEGNLKGLPQEDCSKIMLWNLHIPNSVN
ncbi:Nucleotide-diphospho-sugar transferases superfamily protein [Thalictrum thalictroides]|uniref:Glycosyltransferases n=1 Tax=Thalictrum thalictroides TaxID=46969 RepID=A0A7J6WRK4_THATH|nr:Nucleotide-diphospho-sugar transferases superfamily protein [Thalictrum thalictroides]